MIFAYIVYKSYIDDNLCFRCIDAYLQEMNLVLSSFVDSWKPLLSFIRVCSLAGLQATPRLPGHASGGGPYYGSDMQKHPVRYGIS